MKVAKNILEQVASIAGKADYSPDRHEERDTRYVILTMRRLHDWVTKRFWASL